MTDNPDQPTKRRNRFAVPLGVGAAGLIAGAVLAGTLSANAATSPTPTTAPNGTAAADAPPPRVPESALTDASVADKVKAAVLAKYPGVTINLVETKGDGYEAEYTTAAGVKSEADVSKTFVVGAAHGGRFGGPGGPMGHSNIDPAHEAGESAAQQAEEKARNAQAPANG